MLQAKKLSPRIIQRIVSLVLVTRNIGNFPSKINEIEVPSKYFQLKYSEWRRLFETLRTINARYVRFCRGFRKKYYLKIKSFSPSKRLG